MNYRIDFPIPAGRVVTQGHTDACANFGHATWTVAGKDSGICPRCGEVTRTA